MEKICLQVDREIVSTIEFREEFFDELYNTRDLPKRARAELLMNADILKISMDQKQKFQDEENNKHRREIKELYDDKNAIKQALAGKKEVTSLPSSGGEGRGENRHSETQRL